MKMQKCPDCATYTLAERCPKCGAETKSAHYKFIKIKSVKELNASA